MIRHSYHRSGGRNSSGIGSGDAESDSHLGRATSPTESRPEIAVPDDRRRATSPQELIALVVLIMRDKTSSDDVSEAKCSDAI